MDPAFQDQLFEHSPHDNFVMMASWTVFWGPNFFVLGFKVHLEKINLNEKLFTNLNT